MADCDPATTSDPKGCQPVFGAHLSIPTSTLVGKDAAGNTLSGLTLFQITGIPDCRWNYTRACAQAATDHPKSGSIVVDAPGVTGGNPAAQYLNVRPLLPEDVQIALSASGIPDERALLVSPAYRGQLRTVDGEVIRVFDAFFGIPEKGAKFEGTFGLEFDVDVLTTGNHIDNYPGCVLAKDLPTPYTLDNLLRWDVATKVSETARSADGQFFGAGDKYIDTLINTSCGSSKGTGFSWSMVAYNLEVTPTTYVDGTFCTDGAVFARLLSKLYDDLDVVARKFACSAGGPIDTTTCATLKALLDNGKDKLSKCLDATYMPKTSSGNQNCQAFLSQFKSLGDTIKGTLAPSYVAVDPENRRGELLARVQVIQHVYDDKFVPSVPDGGFTVTESCRP
jgi:hypothetical protein